MATGATRKKSSRDTVRRAGRIGRNLVFATLMSAFVAALGMGLWQLSQVPVETVRVTGELKEVSREGLMQRVSGSLQGGFLLVDLQHIKSSLESLPWVYKVVVKRRWPNSLEIEVSEQRPIARWADVGYLNHAGDLFLPEQMIDDSELPRLAGPDGSAARLMSYYKLVQDSVHAIGRPVEELVMDGRGGISAQLAGGLRLVLGREQIAEKVRRFRRLYESNLSQQARSVASVDLRYSHGAAVAWANETHASTNRKS